MLCCTTGQLPGKARWLTVSCACMLCSDHSAGECAVYQQWSYCCMVLGRRMPGFVGSLKSVDARTRGIGTILAETADAA